MKTMEDKDENKTILNKDDSSDSVKPAPKSAGSPVSVGAIIVALIAGYALGYFPPKRVVAGSPAQGVVAPVPAVTAPAAPAQRLPVPTGGGCGV